MQVSWRLNFDHHSMSLRQNLVVRVLIMHMYLMCSEMNYYWLLGAYMTCPNGALLELYTCEFKI